MASNHQIATIEDVDRLQEEGLLTPESADSARALITTPASREVWRTYGRWALLGLGLIQVLAGVIFFFAANWSLLTKWERLGPIAVVLVLCAGIAWHRHGTLTGKLSLIAATVFVGVFMAVYGQIYQTGADAWTLFANWAGLTLLWAYAASFWPLWMLWMLVLETAVMTFSNQYLGAPESVGLLGCAIVCGLGSWLTTISAEQTPVWVKRVFVINGVGALSLPALNAIVMWTTAPSDIGDYASIASLGMAFVFIIGAFVAWWRQRMTDLFILAVTVALTMALLTAFVVKFGSIDEPLLIGLIIVIQVGAAGAWLKRQWQGQIE